MKYLLDTNICIRYLNGTSIEVMKRLDATDESEIFLYSVVKFELRFGALRSARIEGNLSIQERFFRRFYSFAFDDNAQANAAQVRASLAKSGTPIVPYDLLIAAIALANDLILVTHNTREFSRVRGLKIEDWE